MRSDDSAGGLRRTEQRHRKEFDPSPPSDASSPVHRDGRLVRVYSRECGALPSPPLTKHGKTFVIHHWLREKRLAASLQRPQLFFHQSCGGGMSSLRRQTHLVEGHVLSQLLNREDVQQLVHRRVLRVRFELRHRGHPQQVVLSPQTGRGGVPRGDGVGLGLALGGGQAKTMGAAILDTGTLKKYERPRPKTKS